jgi:hypothetical protein
MVEMSPDWQFLTCRLAVLALTFLTECGCGSADTPASSLRFLEVSFKTDLKGLCHEMNNFFLKVPY